MIKMLFKLVKYSLIIYLMICFKNLYSDSFREDSVITVSEPYIIDINEINKQDADAQYNDPTIFAEKMQNYSEENKKKLEEEQKRLEEARKYVVTGKSYRESLEKGLIFP